MLKKIRWFIFALLAICIGLYPTLYLIADRKIGLLTTKPEALLASFTWNFGFYTHIFFGGLALLIGWTQFSKTLRAKYPIWHRRIGKVYVLAVLLSASAGICIGFFATGGVIAAMGFVCLGLIWWLTTLQAYRLIRKKDTAGHQIMMIYSYAACFAAVTLRIWLPILIGIFHEFNTAYRIVAWLCWVPNLAVAHFLIVRSVIRSRQ